MWENSSAIITDAGNAFQNRSMSAPQLARYLEANRFAAKISGRLFVLHQRENMRMLRSSAVFIVGVSTIGDADGSSYGNENVGNGGMAYK
jgi:hypothetical protein